jgi:hypothetical protein
VVHRRLHFPLLALAAALVLAACVPATKQAPPGSGGGGGGGAAPAPAQPVAQYCASSTPTSSSAYQSAFDKLRKTYTEWASADGSVPVTLPDGRTLWLYGDTFVGSVNGSGTISPPGVLVGNSAVLQSGNCFKPLMGGTPGARSAWIPAPGGQAYWPSSAIVDSAGRLQVFLMHVRYNPFTVFGFKVATFSLPGLSLLGVSSQLPFTDSTHPYGTTALAGNGYAYLYSTNDQNQRVARVPLGSVTNGSAYEFWTGGGWSTSSGAAVPLQFANVPTPVVGINLHAPIAGLWVVPHGAALLGTAKLVNQFSNDVSFFTAAAPEGPWTYVGTAATTPSGVFTYGAQTVFGLQGMPGAPATIFSTNVPGTATTISQYGPRFVTPANVP